MDPFQLHKILANTKLRLKREYDLTDDYVNMAINEYGRFLYLHTISKQVVPGRVIDKVWHDHILHTKEYTEFCNKNF